MTTYIYTIKCPLTDLVKYVGKTNNAKERFRKHLSENNGTKKSRWIKGLRNKGLNPVFEIIDEVVGDWESVERGYIRFYKSIGADLLNQLPGGEGGATMLGRKLTPEQRRKISDSKIGKKRNNYHNKRKGFKIDQFDLAGNYIATHLSMLDAAKSINRSARRIWQMINNKGKTVNHVGGFVFKRNTA